MGEGPVGLAPVDTGGGLTDADEPGGHDGVRGEGTSGRVDPHVVTEAQRLPQDDLLRGERRVQLGGVDRPFEDPGLLGGEPRRRRVGQLPYAQAMCLDAMVNPLDPGGSFAQLASPIPGREDHSGGAVTDRRTVAGAQRSYDIVALRHRTPHLRMGVDARVGPAAGRDGGEGGFVGVARVDEGLGLEGGQGDGVRPQRGDVVRVQLPGQDVAYGAGGRFSVRVHERGVGVARDEFDPGLVERPGAVHLDV